MSLPSQVPQELLNFLKQDFKMKASEIKFIYETKDGEYDMETEWLNLEKSLATKIGNNPNANVYGYQIKTSDGSFFDFWFDSKDKAYVLTAFKPRKDAPTSLVVNFLKALGIFFPFDEMGIDVSSLERGELIKYCTRLADKGIYIEDGYLSIEKKLYLKKSSF